MRAVTALVGAVSEAWSELRVHRTRVLMSLIGIAVAVAAITGVAAVGSVLEQAQTEQSERYGGRPALLSVNVNDSSGGAPNVQLVQDVFARSAARYGIRYSSRTLQGQLNVTTPSGVVQASLLAIDPDYATMHRLRVADGRMPDRTDERRLAPAIVLDANTWRLIGSPALDTHPTVTMQGERPVTAVVIGVQRPDCDQCYSATMLFDAYTALGAASSAGNGEAPAYPSWEFWVPPSQATALKDRIQRDFQTELGEGWQASVNRNDYAAVSGGDPLLPLKIGVGAIGGLVLLLGALGLVNITLVTVRYRIREIGVRRSFGATAGRVFFAVMMESVVATVAAGVIGIMLAIAALKNPWTEQLVAQGIQDVPPFPVSAALLGLAVATGVGALAGLLPALVAVRVKPIDAIRY
jgi:putative ABC transport system permease protein